MLLLPSFGLVIHKPRDSSALIPPHALIIGHRGGSALAPENTLAAFRRALELGVGIELDTMLSADGVPVVIHDYTLERTTNGRGLIANHSWSKLARLDAGRHYSAAFAGEPIPCLAEVLALVAGKVIVNVEVKCEDRGARTSDTGRIVAAVIRASGFAHRILVSSFNPLLLAAVRHAAPEILRSQLYGTFENDTMPFYKKFILRNLILNFRALPDMLAPELSLLDENEAAAMLRCGYRLGTWTANSPEEWAKAVRLGVSLIITDHPDRALLWLKNQSQKINNNASG